MWCFGVPAIPSAPQSAEQNPFIDAQIYLLSLIRQQHLPRILSSVHENSPFCGRAAGKTTSVHEIYLFYGWTFQTSPAVHGIPSFRGR